jgi:predicted RNA-binding Zn ribbon-like protein
MSVAWTPHRFSGGSLALDTANTVVLRGDPALSFDRFDDAAEIARFAAAASHFRRAELNGRRLIAADPEAIKPVVVGIREATDRLFRDFAADGRLRPAPMAGFLRACADGFERDDPAAIAEAAPGPAVGFVAALAGSALALLSAEVRQRLRICPNCRWLFLDRSRNGSRVWCDMAVCGNRAKARRHYNRRRGAAEEACHG